MAIVASQLVGIVSITGADQGVAKLLAVGNATNAAKEAMTGFAVAGAAIAGAALLVLGAHTVQMAADFQQGINRLRTGAGDVQDSFNTLANGVKSVAVNTGTATKPLIDAMYQILSAGQRGSQSLNTLAVSAEGAQIEQAKVVDVSKALTTAMTDFGTRQFNATQFMNGYIRAVQLGKITLEELSTAMGPIIPQAKDMGISFADLSAAMSVQTNAGINSARAATGLRFLMQSLENPTKKALTAFKEFGLNSIAVGDEMRKSLPGALQMIYNAALKAGPEGSVPFNRAISDMIGGQRSLSAFLALTGSHMRDFVSDSHAIAAAMNGSKTAVMGWSTVQGNFNLQMDKARASMEVLGITIGQALLPVLTKIVSAVTPIIVGFTKWITTGDNMKTALAIVAGVLAGLAAIVLAVVIPALITFVATMWPILAIGAGVAAVVAGAILVFQHWGQITSWVGEQFSKLGSMIHGWVSSVGSAIGGFFSNLGETAHSKLTDFKNTVGNAFSQAGTNIHNAITGWGQSIQNFTDWMYKHNYYWKDIVDNFPAALERVKGDIAHKWNEIKTDTGNFFSAVGSIAKAGWEKVYAAFGWFFNIVGTGVRNFLTFVKNLFGGFFSGLGSLVQSQLSQTVHNFGTAFSELGTLVHGKLNDLVSMITGILGGLPSLLFQAGVNMIQGLINGIGSMFSALGSAVSNVAGWISSHLGFHSPPKEGPARDADRWMPNMMAMFASGIAAGTPNLRRALYGALTPVSTSLSVGTSFTSGSYLPGGISIPVGVGGYGSAGGQTIVVQPPDIYLDGVRLSRGLMPHISNAIRYNTGHGFGL